MPSLVLHLRPDEFVSTLRYILVLPSTLLMTPAELIASSMIKFGDHILLEFLGCSKFGNRIALARHNILRVFLKLPPKQGSCKEILLHLKL